MNFDLSQLAGLAALSADPQASAAARDYLARQAQHERQIAAEKSLEESRQALQSSQFNQSISLQQQNAQDQRLQFGKTFEEGKRQFGESQAQQGAQFNAEQKRLRDAEANQQTNANRLFQIQKDELGLKRYQAVQDAIANFTQKSSRIMSGTGAAGSGLGLKDLIGVPETIGSLLLKGNDKQAADLVARGYAVLNQGTGRLEPTPKGMAADALKGELNAIKLGMDPETAKMFDDQVQAMSLETKADAGLLGPEDVDEVLNRSSKALSQAWLSGDKLDPAEQRLFAKTWASMPSAFDKVKALNGIISRTAIQIAQEKGLGPDAEKAIMDAIQEGTTASIENGGYDVTRDFALVVPGIGKNQGAEKPIFGIAQPNAPGVQLLKGAGKVAKMAVGPGSIIRAPVDAVNLFAFGNIANDTLRQNLKSNMDQIAKLEAKPSLSHYETRRLEEHRKMVEKIRAQMAKQGVKPK